MLRNLKLKTASEYLESVRRLDKEVYMFGERIKNTVEFPFLKPTLNSVALTYELVHDPKYADLMTVASHLTGEKINRFTHVPQNTDGLTRAQKKLAETLAGIKTN